jgi:hypothetical protein
MAGSQRTDTTLTGEDFERAVALIEELHDNGRLDEATAIYKLVVAAERAGLRPPAPAEDDLTDEEIEELRRADEDLAAGRIIPDDIARQGRAAVEEFKRRRDAGALDPETAAAIALVRREMGAYAAEQA